MTLTLEKVCFRRGATTVLQELTLRIAQGEMVAVLGPSGAGKSSLLRVLLGLDAPQEGTVRIGGRVASEAGRVLVPPEERGLSVVFQDLALWPHLSVGENLRFVLSSRLSRRQQTERIDAMLARVALAGKRDRYPGELSGGEQQRVALARALVTSPSALLLDEALANLDPVLKGDLLELLRSLLEEARTTALYVTHDPREAARIAQRLVVIEAGRIVQDGDLQAMKAAPATGFVSRAFDGL